MDKSAASEQKTRAHKRDQSPVRQALSKGTRALVRIPTRHEFHQLHRLEKPVQKTSGIERVSCGPLQQTKGTQQKNTDYIRSAYIKANTPWKCRKLDGFWDEKALSRSDFKNEGGLFRHQKGPRVRQARLRGSNDQVQTRRGTRSGGVFDTVQKGMLQG